MAAGPCVLSSCADLFSLTNRRARHSLRDSVVKIDRALQRQILEFLEERYPNSVDTALLPCTAAADCQANLHYLHEHRLVEGSSLRDQGPDFIMVRITARGLDFLADDGGVEAIREKGEGRSANNKA